MVQFPENPYRDDATWQLRPWLMHADHLKLVFPLAWSVTNMAWAMRDGRRLLTHTHFGGSSNWEWGMQTLQYGVDFLLACDFGNGEFVAQV